jgi:hypothetical protein
LEQPVEVPRCESLEQAKLDLAIMKNAAAFSIYVSEFCREPRTCTRQPTDVRVFQTAVLGQAIEDQHSQASRIFL